MRRVLIAALAVLIFFAPAGNAELTVRGGFSGNWTDPIANRQGVQIEIVDGDTAVIAWFTYDAFGQSTWLFGTGEIEGAVIRAEMLRFEGGTFPPGDSDPDAIVSQAWGSVELRFESCSAGTMSWTPTAPGFEPGRMELGRVTAIDGLDCGAPERFQREVRFHFDAGAGRWRALFSDYDEEQRDLLMTEAGRFRLPEPLADRAGYKLAGTNRSDDLAMLMTAPIGGLRPSTTYRVVQTMTFATQVPDNCFGIGGSPGNSVYVQLGASPTRPKVFEDDGRYRLNVGKANQCSDCDGEEALVVGDITNRQQCEQVGSPFGEWQLKTVSTAGRDFIAGTDADGTLWVFGGSDSGFEGRTEFYVTDWIVRLQPIE
ncbi:MAG: hypothetical protein ACNS61_02830 [Candidatus Wenzhouxiangella sp. M2_3B_020]